MDALNGASLLYSPALESVSLTLPPKQAEFLSLEYVDPRPNEVSDSRMKFRDPRRWGAGKQLHRILSFFSGPSRLTRNTIWRSLLLSMTGLTSSAQMWSISDGWLRPKRKSKSSRYASQFLTWDRQNFYTVRFYLEMTLNEVLNPNRLLRLMHVVISKLNKVFWLICGKYDDRRRFVWIFLSNSVGCYARSFKSAASPCGMFAKTNV